MTDGVQVLWRWGVMSIRSDLEEYGLCVVSNVLSEEECTSSRKCIESWLDSLYDDGRFPINANSVIHLYGVAHLEATWRARLNAKKVFAHVWRTDKLLSSLDGMAVGKPIEEEATPEYSPGDEHEEIKKSWLHTDQNWARLGRHAIQGAVYIEEVASDDWTICVLRGSHKYFNTLFEEKPLLREDSGIIDYYQLDSAVKQWYLDKGCVYMRVSVPKGGMVLWDSRTIHANAKPKRNRQNPGRWRMLTFVSMQPAIWATEEDYVKKKEAYEEKLNTSHWAARFVSKMPRQETPGAKIVDKHPEIAKTEEALKLAGIMRYDFDDGKPNGPPLPETKKEFTDNVPSEWKGHDIGFGKVID